MSNRIKDETVQTPLCGKCRSPLIFQKLVTSIALTDLTFDNFVRKANKPVLVDFWANWCAPCRMVSPILESFAKSQHSIVVAKVDTDHNPLTTSKFQVFSIPTMILFVDGQEVKRLVGALPLHEIENQLNPWISVN